MHPKYHLTAPKHWINDPIGFIYYQNNYHLFYQHFPYENKWGTMHWGHATSKDLVNWVDQGIALYPSKDFDANGCFSGSKSCDPTLQESFFSRNFLCAGIGYSKG